MQQQRTTGHFADPDLAGLWEEGTWSDKYNEPTPTDETIARVEAELGFRLPDSYIELMRMRNGGGLTRNSYPMDETTGWAENHVEVMGIYGIGNTAIYSLCGESGSTFMRDDWGYPSWGVGIADTPSAGHEQLMLDYRDCGPHGEPRVVYVEQENDYAVTPVAADFATFIRGLVPEEEFDDSAQAAADALITVQNGSLSPVLHRALKVQGTRLPFAEDIIRGIGTQLVKEKGHFSLHGDELSELMYDVIFWLYSGLKTAESFDDYFSMAEGQLDYDRPCHVLMMRVSLVADPYRFHTGGYARSSVHEWWTKRVQAGQIVEMAPANGQSGFRMSDDFETQLLALLSQRGTV